MPIVYVFTNKINGKQYVGYTKLNLSHRAASHIYDSLKGSTYPFHAAIRKYGMDNFDAIIVLECETVEEAQLREYEWIDHLKTREVGYNVAKGGDGGFTSEMAKRGNDTKRKNGTIGNAGRVHKGKKFSEQHRKALSLGCDRDWETD